VLLTFGATPCPDHDGIETMISVFDWDNRQPGRNAMPGSRRD